MVAILQHWDELTQNRLVKKVIGSNISALYSAMSIIYFFVQILVLISAADSNHSAADLIKSILVEAHINPYTDYAHLESNKTSALLRICPDGISQSSHLENCPVIFPVNNIHGPVATTAKRYEEYTMVPVFSDSGSNLTSFMMLEEDAPTEVIAIPPVCVRALEWPYQTLLQTRRADITVACYHAWLLIMSIIAIFCQSNSHLGAAFVAHVLSFIWSTTQIAGIVNFRADYRRLITSANGACDGVDFLVSYFKDRLGYEIGMTVVNFVAIFMSAYLTWRLLSVYGLADVRGLASPIMKRAYLLAISLSVITQLTIFFYMASIGIWLDEITKHVLGARISQQTVNLVVYSFLIAFVGPWLYLAWYGVRRESKRLMIAFFANSVLYLTGTFALFASGAFRQTLMFWSFLSGLFFIALILMIAAIVLAVLCQFNFGIGLPYYLDTHNDEPTDAAYPSYDAKGDMEKADLEGAREVVLTLPGAKTPKRDASVSSKSSTLYSEGSYGYTKGRISGQPIVAAQPGSIKILPPVPSAVPTSSEPSPIAKTPTKSLRLYGKDLWGRSKRHESAISFGHMDASKLDRNSTRPGPRGVRNNLRLPSGITSPFAIEASSFSPDESVASPPIAQFAAPRNQKVDSMGSIYSTQSGKPQLFLVTNVQ